MKISKFGLLKFLKNKYFIISFLFVLYLTLFSQNNLIERLSGIHDLNKLEAQKEYYLKIIEENSEKIKELRTDKSNLEKFAREEYLMKKNNEDIFVIVKK